MHFIAWFALHVTIWYIFQNVRWIKTQYLGTSPRSITIMKDHSIHCKRDPNSNVHFTVNKMQAAMPSGWQQKICCAPSLHMQMYSLMFPLGHCHGMWKNAKILLQLVPKLEHYINNDILLNTAQRSGTTLFLCHISGLNLSSSICTLKADEISCLYILSSCPVSAWWANWKSQPCLKKTPIHLSFTSGNFNLPQT